MTAESTKSGEVRGVASKRVHSSIALQATAVLSFPLAVCMGSFAGYFAVAMLVIFFYGGYQTLKFLPAAEGIGGDMPKLPSVGKSSFLVLGFMILLFVLSLTYDIDPLASGPLALILTIALYASLVANLPAARRSVGH